MDDTEMIEQIAFRAAVLFIEAGLVDSDKEDVVCSGIIGELFIVHTQIVPLDLFSMMTGNDVDLAHDVAGIHRHLKHTSKSARLTGGFYPRYAVPQVGHA